MLEGIESKNFMKEKSKFKVVEKSKRIEVESMDKPKENENERKGGGVYEHECQWSRVWHLQGT